MKRILIIENEGLTRWSLKKFLQEKFDVDTAQDWLEAKSLMKECEFDLLITDFRLPGQDGIKSIGEAHKIDPSIKSILMTAYPVTVEDYLAKNNGDKPDLVLDKMLNKDDLINEVKSLI